MHSFLHRPCKKCEKVVQTNLICGTLNTCTSKFSCVHRHIQCQFGFRKVSANSCTMYKQLTKVPESFPHFNVRIQITLCLHSIFRAILTLQYYKHIMLSVKYYTHLVTCHTLCGKLSGTLVNCTYCTYNSYIMTIFLLKLDIINFSIQTQGKPSQCLPMSTLQKEESLKCKAFENQGCSLFLSHGTFLQLPPEVSQGYRQQAMHGYWIEKTLLKFAYV